LIVALILLVVMTLLGLSAMRSVTLEEKMAANTVDRSLSFQAAEAALREAESLLAGAMPPAPAAGSACVAGVCGAPPPGAPPRWLNANFTGWQAGTATVSGPITVTPQYFIEYLGSTFPCNPNDSSSTATCKRYRVTARSDAGAGRAVVMLQSIYATP
jgi:type IV pilus assembly protein PilX